MLICSDNILFCLPGWPSPFLIALLGHNLLLQIEAPVLELCTQGLQMACSLITLTNRMCALFRTISEASGTRTLAGGSWNATGRQQSPDKGKDKGWEKGKGKGKSKGQLAIKHDHGWDDYSAG